jgi:predicted metal-dependent hydrolase
MSTIDEVIRTRRRTIALMITPDARLIVRAPAGVPLKYLEDIVAQKEKWIRRTQDAMRQRDLQRAEKCFVQGELFLYLGADLKLEIEGKNSGIRIDGDRLIFPAGFITDAKNKLVQWYRKEARRVFQERVSHFSSLTGIQYTSVRISGAKHNWGSCGPKGTLNFTWYLIMAPLPVIDYIVVHELVHVLIKNHSKSYWAKVSAIMPDHKSHRRWLNAHQHILSGF